MPVAEGESQHPSQYRAWMGKAEIPHVPSSSTTRRLGSMGELGEAGSPGAGRLCSAPMVFRLSPSPAAAHHNW